MKIFTTSNKLLINDWRGLREILINITAADNDTNSILSDSQLQEATDGPYHSLIKNLLSTYSLISKIRLHLTITHNDTLQQHIYTQIADLPKINKDLNTATLDKMQKKIDQLANAQFQAWQELITDCGNNLVMHLTLNEINLSDIEIEQLTHYDLLSELLKRSQELKLELPKIKNTFYYFEDYFKIKVILCLNSALSRQHKSHTSKDIQAILKSLKNDFKHIHQEEINLIKTQQKEINECLENF